MTGPDTSSSLELMITALSESTVDSTHSTSDFHKIEKDLVEGDVVTTYTDNVTGQFGTDAEMATTTITNTSGTFHFEIEPVFNPNGPSTDVSMEANSSFDDHRTSTSLTIAEQSGSYGDGENDSSSYSLSVTHADEYYSDAEGDYTWESTGAGISMSGSYTNHEEGSSDRVFADERSFAPSGNSASWYTSYERERSWTIETEGDTYGFVTPYSDSGSESYSESSGSQSYEPGEEEDPSDNYRPRGDEEGQGERGEEGDGSSATKEGPRYIGDPRYSWWALVRMPDGSIRFAAIDLLPKSGVRVYGVYAFNKGDLDKITPEVIENIEATEGTRLEAEERQRQAAIDNNGSIGFDPYGKKRNAISAEFLSKKYYNEWDLRTAQNKLERDLYYAGKSDEYRKWHEFNSGLWTHHDDFLDRVELENFLAETRANASAALAGMAGAVPTGRASLSPPTSRSFSTPQRQRYFPPTVARTGPVSPKTKVVIPSPKETSIRSNVLTDAQKASKAISSGTKPTGWTGKWGDPHGNKEVNLPTTDAFGRPITYREYYLPKNPGDVTKWGANRLVVGSDGSVYVTTTHYGQSGNPPFIYLGQL